MVEKCALLSVCMYIEGRVRRTSTPYMHTNVSENEASSPETVEPTRTVNLHHGLIPTRTISVDGSVAIRGTVPYAVWERHNMRLRPYIVQ